MYIHVHTCVYYNMHVEVWGQPVSQFSFSTLRTPGLELRSLGLTAAAPGLFTEYGPLCWLSKILATVNRKAKVIALLWFINMLPSRVNEHTALFILVKVSFYILSYVKMPYRTNLENKERAFSHAFGACSTSWLGVGQVLQLSSAVSGSPSLWDSRFLLKWLFHT